MVMLKKIGGVIAAGLLVVGMGACSQSPPGIQVDTLHIELDIQTLELAVGESFTVVPTVTADGTAVTDPELQWSSTDPQVVQVSGGVVRPVGVGTAVANVTCQYGGKEAEASLKITVTKPVKELLPETPVVLDLSREEGGVVAFQLPPDAANADSATIGGSEYRLIHQGEQTLIQTTFLQPGEYIMSVEQEKQTVSFPVYAASMVISSADDLQKAVRLADADTGYFVLDRDIDCGQLIETVCFTEKAVFETNLGQNRDGFRGGFNGMGYTISNLKVPENGLFGCIGASGVVRNLALTNVQAEKNVICKDNAGLISQVYVQGDFSRVLRASYCPTNKLENIVAESVRPDAMLCQHIATVDTDGYSVSDIHALIMVGENAQISGWSRTEQFSSLTADADLRVFSGSTRDSIPEVTAKDGFNGYWDITSGYPIFISSM